MDEIRDAILADQLDAIGGLRTPESYRAVVVRKDEQDMFAGLATREKDPRKSLHVEEVPTPQLGPGEAIVAVMAPRGDYNTGWASIFEAGFTLRVLERHGPLSQLNRRHRPPHHAGGSGPGGRGWPAGTTCPITWSARTWPGWCCGSARG